jgi:hypothetical protein
MSACAAARRRLRPAGKRKRARLNRRSTIRCTRRRKGLNRAAAASMDAATANWV